MVLAPVVAKGDTLRVRGAAAAVWDWASEGGVAALVVDDGLSARKGPLVDGA